MLSRASADVTWPIFAAEILARVSGDIGWPIFAAEILARVLGDIGWPISDALILARVSAEQPRLWFDAATAARCVGVALAAARASPACRAAKTS
jgi:hypothetical protein